MIEEPVNALQERGARATSQRAHIWRVLAEPTEHFTAEEVWERARSALPGLELSTVHRLEALRAAGLVADSRLPEGSRVFEAGSSSHPHLVCEEIFHPAIRGSATAVRGVECRLGRFEVRELHVVARGTCARCAPPDKE